MNIKHDESYLYLYADMEQAGFTNKAIQKICFESKDTESIKKIADYLERTYRMYQYVKDNGVKFGTEDLFFWTNERDYRYFDVTCSSDVVAYEVVDYVENIYSDKDIYVRIQYEHRTNWDAVNSYLTSEFDINNIDIDKFRPLYQRLYSPNQMTEESRKILYKANETYLSQFENKKVSYTNLHESIFGNSSSEMKGTIKRIGNSEFGFFKPRQTKTYYPIDLGKIKSLTLA